MIAWNSRRDQPQLSMAPVVGAMAVALAAQPVMAANSERMLIARDGSVCYVDFDNAAGGASDWVSLYDHRYTGALPKPGTVVQTALVRDGVVVARDAPSPTSLAPGEHLALGQTLAAATHHSPRVPRICTLVPSAHLQTLTTRSGNRPALFVVRAFAGKLNSADILILARHGPQSVLWRESARIRKKRRTVVRPERSEHNRVHL